MTELFDDEHAHIFFKALLSIDSVEQCRDFFMDLCTIKELEAMVQRYHVARMLSDKKLYTEIVKETGASTATISRVNRCLAYGRDGYQTVIKKCEDSSNA